MKKEIIVAVSVLVVGLTLTIVGVAKYNPFFAMFGAGILTKGICMLIDHGKKNA